MAQGSLLRVLGMDSVVVKVPQGGVVQMRLAEALPRELYAAAKDISPVAPVGCEFVLGRYVAADRAFVGGSVRFEPPRASRWSFKRERV